MSLFYKMILPVGRMPTLPINNVFAQQPLCNLDLTAVHRITQYSGVEAVTVTGHHTPFEKVQLTCFGCARHRGTVNTTPVLSVLGYCRRVELEIEWLGGRGILWACFHFLLQEPDDRLWNDDNLLLHHAILFS